MNKTAIRGSEMKRAVGLWQLCGFAVIVLVGTLLHFMYDWLGGAAWIAPFSGVNESTWEHMKLLFWPMLAFTVVESFFFRDYENFWCVKLRGTVIGLSLIPIIFYTYNGVIGKSPDWVNIGIFFVSAAIAAIYEARHLAGGEKKCNHPKLAFLALCLIGALFIAFTFFMPRIGIFQDPITGGFGI